MLKYILLFVVISESALACVYRDPNTLDWVPKVQKFNTYELLTRKVDRYVKSVNRETNCEAVIAMRELEFDPSAYPKADDYCTMPERYMTMTDDEFVEQVVLLSRRITILSNTVLRERTRCFKKGIE